MNLAVLYSGGKDSTLALHLASQHHRIVGLITICSKNSESYMFQTANIHMTHLQAEALGLPIIGVKSKGEKEIELKDLSHAISQAKTEWNIQGIVTGAVRSTYQASRIQQICSTLNVWCFNPLWLRDQVELLHNVLQNKITAFISGIFAEPLDQSFLGKIIDNEMILKLESAARSHRINPAGEGGEIETTVLDAPLFKKRIEVLKTKIDYKNHAGVAQIEEARLVNK